MADVVVKMPIELQTSKCLHKNSAVLRGFVAAKRATLTASAGIVGFDKNFGTTASFTDEGTDELFEVMKKGTPTLQNPLHIEQSPAMPCLSCYGQRVRS